MQQWHFICQCLHQEVNNMKQKDFLLGKSFEINGIRGTFTFKNKQGDIHRSNDGINFYKYAEVIFISRSKFHAAGYFFNTFSTAEIPFSECNLKIN